MFCCFFMSLFIPFVNLQLWLCEVSRQNKLHCPLIAQSSLCPLNSDDQKKTRFFEKKLKNKLWLHYINILYILIVLLILLAFSDAVHVVVHDSSLHLCLKNGKTDTVAYEDILNHLLKAHIDSVHIFFWSKSQ